MYALALGYQPSLTAEPLDPLEREQTILAAALDACFCDDGRGLPECQQCTKNRQRYEEITKLLAT